MVCSAAMRASRRVELGAGEAPLERLRDLDVVALEVEDGALETGQVGEVVGLEQLALEDREVDLDLVQPTGMDGQVDEAYVRPASLEPLDAVSASVRRAVVDDQEDAAG